MVQVQQPAYQPNITVGQAAPPYNAAIPEPQNTSNDPFRQSFTTTYVPYPFTLSNGQQVPRNPFQYNLWNDGSLIFDPQTGQAPPFFNGSLAFNQRVGSEKVTGALNNIGLLTQIIDATSAYQAGISPVDPSPAYLYSDSRGGAIANFNPQLGLQPQSILNAPRPA